MALVDVYDLDGEDYNAQYEHLKQLYTKKDQEFKSAQTSHQQEMRKVETDLQGKKFEHANRQERLNQIDQEIADCTQKQEADQENYQRHY